MDLHQALTRVIAVVNGKGGVGKTTITANVGGLLAAGGSHVLLVDLDPQGNLAEELGYTGTDLDDGGRSLAQALVFGGRFEPARDVRGGLDVLVGGPELDMAAAGLTMKAQKDPVGAKLALAAGLAEIAGEYDLVLIDCPPGQETLQQAALAAARWALIPVKTDSSSRKGLRDVARRLRAVIDVNPELDLLGVVLFGVNRSASRVVDSARAAIAGDLGSDSSVFATSIRHVEAAAQEVRDRGLLVHELEKAVAAGPTWWQIRRAGRAEDDSPRVRSAGGLAEDYQMLGEEIISRIAAGEAVAAEPTLTGARP